MTIVRGALVAAAGLMILVMLSCLDWLLVQPKGTVLITGIMAGIVIGVGLLVAILSSMFSSKLSREEEAAHRNHAVKVEDYNPRGNIWS